MKKGILCFSLILLVLVGASTGLAASASKPSGRVVYASLNQNFASAIGGDHRTIKWLQTWVPLVHEPLFRKDLKADITPALAESWEIGDDGLSIKMKLRKGPTFHDGTPITAHDVKFSIECYKDDKYRMVFYKELQAKLKSVEVIDDHTVLLRFNEAYNAFWDRFFEYYQIIPKNYIEKVGDEEYAKHPIGSGPFKWVDYKQDAWIELEAYEGHYRHVPEFKTFRMAFVPEHATRLAMLKTGEADLITPDAVNLNRLRKDPNYRLVQAENCRTINLAFADLIREGDLPLKDRRVRMAVSYAIDRKAICDVVMQGEASPSNSFLAPWHAGWDPQRAEPTPYDPEKAKALLKEAGYPDGFSTQLTVFPMYKRQMQAVAGYLGEVGIKTKINIVEIGTYTEICHAKKAEGLFWRDAWWNARTHPTSPIDVQMTLKAPWSCGITTQRVSDAIEAVGKIPIGHPDLAKKAAEMDDIITEDLPRINLWAKRNIIALGPRIQDYKMIEGFLVAVNMEYITLKK